MTEFSAFSLDQLIQFVEFDDPGKLAECAEGWMQLSEVLGAQRDALRAERDKLEPGWRTHSASLFSHRVDGTLAALDEQMVLARENSDAWSQVADASREATRVAERARRSAGSDFARAAHRAQRGAVRSGGAGAALPLGQSVLRRHVEAPLEEELRRTLAQAARVYTEAASRMRPLGTPQNAEEGTGRDATGPASAVVDSEIPGGSPPTGGSPPDGGDENQMSGVAAAGPVATGGGLGLIAAADDATPRGADPQSVLAGGGGPDPGRPGPARGLFSDLANGATVVLSPVVSAQSDAVGPLVADGGPLGSVPPGVPATTLVAPTARADKGLFATTETTATIAPPSGVLGVVVTGVVGMVPTSTEGTTLATGSSPVPIRTRDGGPATTSSKVPVGAGRDGSTTGSARARALAPGATGGSAAVGVATGGRSNPAGPVAAAPAFAAHAPAPSDYWGRHRPAGVPAPEPVAPVQGEARLPGRLDAAFVGEAEVWRPSSTVASVIDGPTVTRRQP
ncbi:MAG: hypothetical protein ACRCYX_02830 [Dermatophilaceae bacterium]